MRPFRRPGDAGVQGRGPHRFRTAFSPTLGMILKHTSLLDEQALAAWVGTAVALRIKLFLAERLCVGHGFVSHKTEELRQ
jgi:hypothetical protein